MRAVVQAPAPHASGQFNIMVADSSPSMTASLAACFPTVDNIKKRRKQVEKKKGTLLSVRLYCGREDILREKMDLDEFRKVYMLKEGIKEYTGKNGKRIFRLGKILTKIPSAMQHDKNERLQHKEVKISQLKILKGRNLIRECRTFYY